MIAFLIQIRQLQDVLKAFCMHNSSIGYCQGMNFIVGIALLFLEPEDAFWLLVTVTEKYFYQNYFNNRLIGVQADQEYLKELIKCKIPDLASHLKMLDIDLSSITLSWFLSIFYDAIPFEVMTKTRDIKSLVCKGRGLTMLFFRRC